MKQCLSSSRSAHEFFRFGLAHDKARGGAVREEGGVSGRDCAVGFAEGGLEGAEGGKLHFRKRREHTIITE